MLKKTLTLAAVGAVALAAGCGDDDKDKSSSKSESESTKAAQPRKAANVSFTAPAEGATVKGSTVYARVDLKGFAIDAKDVGKKNVPGKGHLHFSLDGGKFDHPKYSGANGQLAVKLGVDGMYSPSTEPKITYSGLPKGKHTLEVDLANNDHSPTGASATTTFVVQ